MKKRKIMYTIFFILLITITCVVVNINRKEQNNIMAQLSRQKFDVFIMN